MRDHEQSSAVLDLPHLAEVFEALRRGRHVAMKDGEIFYALKKHASVYEQLFSRLGFKLIHHPRDFFYFLDSSNFSDLSSRIAVFMFILVEHLADQGEAVEDAVMTRRFACPELPHLHGERYQTYMREAGVTTPEDLAAIVRTMERFGFARRADAETFSFDVPIYRFLDLCMELANAAATAADGAQANVADAGEVAP